LKWQKVDRVAVYTVLGYGTYRMMFVRAALLVVLAAVAAAFVAPAVRGVPQKSM
jgi:hypothetical protein